VADVDRAGVFSGALQHAWSGRRQRPQVNARALIAAVLRPHDREDSELGDRRHAAERIQNALVLLARQTVALEYGIGNEVWSHFVRTPTEPTGTAVAENCLPAPLITDSKITRPSALPTASSQARSGCGIRPTTFRASFVTPAMLWTDPFGFAAS